VGFAPFRVKFKGIAPSDDLSGLLTMKFRLALASIGLSLLFAPDASMAQSLPDTVSVCTDGFRLNLRETPEGRVLTTLNEGDVVERVAPPAGAWQPVAFGNYRGYVWADYLCENNSTPNPIPPVSGLQPATCPNVDSARNLRHPGGLNVHRAPNSNSEIVGFLNDGAAILLGGNATENAAGETWYPIDQPLSGFIPGGDGEGVTNIVYCTRFYP